MDPKFSYHDKINSISSYFGVTNEAAKYMYHRRRYGFPFKKENDPNFIRWDNKVLNALIKADKLEGFNWDLLLFDDDMQLLLEKNINVNLQSDKIDVYKGRNSLRRTQQFEKYDPELKKSSNTVELHPVELQSKETENNDWVLVTSNKGQLIRRNILRKIGFLSY